ncbi:hypothetical protein ALT1000_240010 [Alteromonas macleodii]
MAPTALTIMHNMKCAQSLAISRGIERAETTASFELYNCIATS